MSVVLRLWAAPGGDSAMATLDTKLDAVIGMARGEKPVDLEYVKRCDVDAFNGRGYVEFTRDIKQARRFTTTEDAWKYWKRQSRVCPFRDDGKPNRPLTAYNVTFEDVE
jgi:hypothetical protein